MSLKFLIFASVAALLLANANGAPHQLSLVEDASYLVPSRVLFDFATHVLQTGKMAAAMQNLDDSGALPEFTISTTYTFDYMKDVCSENGSCQSIQEFVSIGGYYESSGATTVLKGALDNDARVIFNLSNFTYTFHVPNFSLTSTDFQRIVTNLNTDVQHAYSGLHLKVANSTIGISADFDFQGHFSVSNVKVLLDLGEVSMHIANHAQRVNGTWTDLLPIDEDAAPQLMDIWGKTDEFGETLEKRYNQYLEQQINEILAGGATV